MNRLIISLAVALLGVSLTVTITITCHKPGGRTGVDAGITDAGEETGSDAHPDAIDDADEETGSDAHPDATADADVDQECHGLAELRAMAVGAQNLGVSMRICGAMVTLADPDRLFIQEGPEGPAIQAWPADNHGTSEGDRITIDVIMISDFHGNQTISGYRLIRIDGQEGDLLADWVQPLSRGILPAEEIEAELIMISGATVTALNGRLATVSYGTASGVTMLLPADVGSLCVGAELNVWGTVTEWSDDRIHRIEVLGRGGIIDADVSACQF